MTERIVNCKYGYFKFIKQGNFTDVWFNDEHMGYHEYLDLDTATDLELLEAASETETDD